MGYPYKKEISLAAERYKLDPILLAAIVSSESDFRPEVSRYEPKFQARYIDNHPSYCFLPDYTRALLATSFGLTQILGVTAVEGGLQVFDLDKLYEPEYNLEYGCRHLAKIFKKYGPKVERVIAAYNAGSPRKGPKGNWVNHKYVTRTMKRYQQFSSLPAPTLPRQGGGTLGTGGEGVWT